MNTSMESLSIEIESTAKESTGSVDRLIQQLDKLRTSLQNVINESTNFSKLKSNLESVSKGVSTKASAKAASPSVPYERQLFEANLKYDPEEDLSGYYKLKNEIKSLDSTTTSYIGKQGELVTVSRKGKDELEKVRVTVKRTGEESKTASNNWKKLTSSFTFSIAKIAAVYAGLSRLASKVADFVKEASNYEEALNLFTVTMGENAEKATEWVTKFSDALYLDPSSVMQYMGSFNSLVKGLGLGADKSYIMSKNLTQLTYDLASFKNLSFDEAFRKLQSATSGEIEPLILVAIICECYRKRSEPTHVGCDN